MGSFLKDIQKAVKKTKQVQKKIEKMVDKPVKKETLKPKKSGEYDEGLIVVSVVGSKYVKDQKPIKEIEDGDIVKLKQDPGNEHDSEAIRVLDNKGRMLGYIPKGKEQKEINRLIDSGYIIEAEIEIEDEEEDLKEMSVRIEYH